MLDDILSGQKNVLFKRAENEKCETINMKDGYLIKSFQMGEEVTDEVFIGII